MEKDLLGMFLQTVLEHMKEQDEIANRNANHLWIEFGDGVKYEQERRKDYLRNTHFIYRDYIYKIKKVLKNNVIVAKQLGSELRRNNFSGRRESRKIKFSIGSNLDKEAILYKKGEL